MNVSLRINDEDCEIIRAYADMNGMSMSELFRKAVMERIEDELDLKAYEDAMAEYRADPVTYSLEEVAEELNLL